MFQWGLGISKKLLHHSEVSFTPSGTVTCFCRCCNSLVNGYCGMYAVHLRGTCYGFVQSLTCTENVPLKQAVPVKHLLIVFIHHSSSYQPSSPAM